VISQDEAEDLCVIVGVFIHWEAQDDKKIFDWNYQATKEAIARAMAAEPTVSTVIEQEAAARHPFASGVEASGAMCRRPGAGQRPRPTP